MLIYDIGFNEGFFSKTMRHFYPDCVIVGIEGNDNLVNTYNQNYKTDGITVFHAVMSNEVKKDVDFFICDSNTAINSINRDWINKIRHKHFYDNTERSIKVNSITLDYMIGRFGIPSIIKLDIEGAESMALEGLSQKAGFITFEWSEDYIQDAMKCVNKLKTLGYSHFAITEETDIFNPYLEYKPLDQLDLYNNVDVMRKVRWGMLYIK